MLTANSRFGVEQVDTSLPYGMSLMADPHIQPTAGAGTHVSLPTRVEEMRADPIVQHLELRLG
jgi:hypothetical protein